MSEVPQVQLRDGHMMPRFGFGFWQVPPDIATAVATTAIDTGFRLLDTAEAYYNEAEVGTAIRRSGVAREDLFVTTKVWNENHGRDKTLRAFDASMKRLGLAYLDLYLMHWPSQMQNRYVETWKAFVELRASGRVRSIGVSNFAASHLERIIGETGVAPVLNQIELHPRFQQRAMRRVHAEYGIVTESWSPLGLWKSRDPAILDPSIRSIAQKHRRTPAQVILRWHLQSGLVPLTRSSRPDRIRENFETLGFLLDDEDMQLIHLMDSRMGRLGPNPVTAEF